MAGRPQNRLELRRQYEAAEPPDPIEDESDDVIEETDEEEERRPKKKRAPAKSKAKAAKPAKPAARTRIVWAVVNDAFKTVATFEFSQKDAALAKAAEMTAKGKGTHFVQKVKEAMSEDAPGLGASIPREAAPKAAKAAAPAAAAAAVEEDEDDEDEGHDDEDEGHDDEDE